MSLAPSAPLTTPAAKDSENMATADSITVLGIHPAAEIFPLIEGASLVDLANDIKANGLREPVTLHPDGRILDGRNRYRACGLVGVEPSFRTWNGEGSPVAYVVSLNLHRRHLDASQLAMVGERIANMRQGERTDLEPSANLQKVAIEEASDLVNVSPRSIHYAREVRNHGTPELVQAVERGEVAVSTAASLTELEPELQTAIVNLPESERKAAIKAHVSNNSGNNEWYTPPPFIEAAREAMGGITLDPASSPVANRIICAEQFYTASDDGLKQQWRGNVWMNPPYSQPLIMQFAEAVCEKYAAKEIKRACVLVNNATETVWFQMMLTAASAVCFLKGRIKYLDHEGVPANTPLQGQAVLYLGENPFRFAKAFNDLGAVLYREA